MFPSLIITSSERPVIVLYFDLAKVMAIIELTSPAEENMEKWNYEKLVQNIREGGFRKVFAFTVEVGARGFVAKRTANVWRRVGLNKDMAEG